MGMHNGLLVLRIYLVHDTLGKIRQNSALSNQENEPNLFSKLEKLVFSKY